MIALLVTGGFEFELFGIEVRSHHVDKPLRNLVALAVLRLATTAHWTSSVAALAGFLVAAAIGESTLRLWAPAIAAPHLVQIHRASADYGWALLPNARGRGALGEKITINATGLREDAEPADPAVHIAILGDSFTFGMGANLEDTFAKQLQAALDTPARPVHVSNFGVIGYHLWQYLAVLEQAALPSDPDLVVVALFLDDLSAPNRPADMPAEGRNPFARNDAEQFGHSALVNTGRNLVRLFEARYRHHRGAKYLRGIDERKEEITGEHPYYPLSLGIIDADTRLAIRAALRRMKRMTEAAGVPLLVIYIPDASQLHEPERQQLNGFIATELDRLDIDFIDVTPRFDAADDPRPLYLFPLDAHTSRTGHALIAEAIAEHSLVKALSGQVPNKVD